tara:strand:+ start:150 stop:362 length:213 start_codon:yes stop_codon:yes gene_type:complete
MSYKHRLYNAAYKRFEADRESAIATLSVYLNSAVGIGEHPDLLEVIVEQTKKLAEADEALETLIKHKDKF